MARRKASPPLAEMLVAAAAAGTLVSAAGRAVISRRDGTDGPSGPGPRTSDSGGRADAGRAPGAGAQERATGDGGQPKGLGRLKARLERMPVIGGVLRVQRRYSDLRGNNLAAAVTFQAFVSLLPLLLVVIAVVGFVSAGSGTDVAGRIVAELGLTGDAATAVTDAVSTAERSRRAASVLGLLGLAWSGLGLVGAIQYGLNQAWQVEERGMKDRAVAVVWLVGAALLFVATAAVTTVLRWLPGVLAPAGVAVTLLVNFALWLWTMRVLPNTRVPWRALVPGAVLGAVGLEALKLAGAHYEPNAVSSSSQLYGSIGVVLALLAWLFFFGRLIIYSAVLNVVLHEQKAGTVRAVIEVPRQPGAHADDDVTRTGRLDRASLDA